MAAKSTREHEPHWVTVADAAKALTAAGDTIDASNVSRYLARHADIPSKKEGKFRRVDLKSLAEHRKVNIFVADKQSARGIEAGGDAPAPLLPMQGSSVAADDSDPSLGDVNLALKKLDLRQKQRDQDLADGKVVPDTEVLTLISTVLQSFVAALERQEATIAQQYGREVAARFRQCRKAAQADAARRLGELAKKHLPAALVPSAMDAATVPAESEAVAAAA